MNVVMASCDEKYFQEHGYSFVKSCKNNGEKPWINIVCPLDEWNRIRKTYKSDDLILSRAVQITGDRIEYACSRFHIASEILNTADAMLIVDIDSFLRKPIQWQDFDDCDYSLFLRPPLPGTVGWEMEGTRCAAGAVYLSQKAKPFIDLVSKTMHSYGSKWFVDQVSLWEVHNHFQINNLGLRHIQMPNKYIDWEFHDDSIIWTGKGTRKNSVPYLKGRADATN